MLLRLRSCRYPLPALPVSLARLSDRASYMTAKTSTETNGCLDNKKMARRSEPVVNGVVSPTSATGNSERSPKRAKADTEPKDEKKPGAKTEKKVLLPNEPVGIRYEESMRPPSLEGSSRTFMSWNVAGLRGLLKKDPAAISKLVQQEHVDVLCLQETKLQGKNIEEVRAQLDLPGWSVHWCCSVDKLGYAGVVTLYRESAFPKDLTVTHGLQATEHDGEGRVITLEMPDMYLVNVYVPNSGNGLKRLEYRISSWDTALASHVDKLRKEKPVVITGDFNCAREPIDIHNARNNLKSAGFTPEERESFQKLYMEKGWVDTFREQHPGVHGYTYYGYRHDMRTKRKGWRLDYFLVSESLKPRLHDSFILTDFLGSDHCPLGLTLKL